MKNSKIFEIHCYFTVSMFKCPRQQFFVFIKSLQNCSHVFFPNFWQNIAEIPNSMGHFAKILEKNPWFSINT